MSLVASDLCPFARDYVFVEVYAEDVQRVLLSLIQVLFFSSSLSTCIRIYHCSIHFSNSACSKNETNETFVSNHLNNNSVIWTELKFRIRSCLLVGRLVS